MTWVMVGALAAVCVGMRVTVPLLLGDRRPERLSRSLTFAVPALLAALLITGTLADGRALVADARIPGVLAAIGVTAARGPLLLAVVAACATTAAVRALAGVA